MASTTTDRAAGESGRMRAVTARRYGSPDVLEVSDVERPTPAPDEVLVRVRASTVGPPDSATREGSPAPIRLFSGLRRPKAIPGDALAGVVEATGATVTRFAEGDRVFGTTAPETGAHAEYVCLAEDAVLAVTPSSVDHGEAATVADGGLTALAFLRDVVDLRAGQSILVNGASGGVGTFAVQLAAHFGADVTGVCSTDNVALVESLGADTVLDYTETDFTATGERYDVVFDVVGKRSYPECRDSLTPTGVYLTTVPSAGVGYWVARTRLGGGRRAKFAATGVKPASEKQVNLGVLRELLDQGELRAVVDRTYPLEAIAEAHRYVDTGHKVGAVVLAMD
ncbi:NAD(P)-dependent alcohol dehydrogenase [Halomarina rubra]|uniref:NAD(P)-dependent alcohol dehydrogenase n=2 Tax=Halomarina rubra TaxID=2071873 RepID=A0ABD6AUD9_9EURY